MTPEIIFSSRLVSNKFSLLSFFLLLSICQPFKIYPSAKKDVSFPLQKCFSIETTNSAFILPASDNESVLLFGDRGTVSSYNAEMSKIHWTSEVGGRFLTKPFISGQNLFLTVNIENVEKPEKVKIYSLSLKTGITNWSKTIESNSDENLYELMPAKENTVIFSNNTSLIRIDTLSGETTSRLDRRIKLSVIPLPDNENNEIYLGDSEKFITKTKFDLNEIKFPVRQFIADFEPIRLFLDKNRNLYISDDSGKLYFHRKFSKNADWKVKLGGKLTSFTETRKGLIVTSLDNFVYMLSIRNGRTIWKKRLGGRIISPPLLESETLIAGAFGEPVVEFIDIRDGRTVNRIALQNEEFLVDTPVFINDRYILLTNKNIYVYQIQNCEKA